MKTVLHLTPSGSQFWRQSREGWQPHDGPSSGPVWVVTDLAEEGFAEIQIPRIFGRDRQAFVARQVANRFPDTAYRTGLPVRHVGGLMDRIAPPRQSLLGLDAAQRIDAALATLASPLAGVWTTSMLLAQIGCKATLPPELFVALPGPDALRIVVIKNREPVLTRLIAGVTLADDQAAEIVRTLRHLENTRVLARGTHRHGVLMLGGDDAMAARLAPDQLELLALPPPWSVSQPDDWRFALFDLAIKSPPGQLAPLARRAEFVASQWRQLAYGASVLVVGLSVWVASDNLRAIAASEAGRTQAQADLQGLTVQLTEAEQRMKGFGVAADVVHRAVTLDREEILSAPALAGPLHQLGAIVGRHEAVRLGQLSWRLLPPGRPACAGGAPNPTGAAEPTAADGAAVVPARRVELSFDITPPEAQRATTRAQMVSSLSSALGKLDGVSLVRDPAKEMPQAALSGGASNTDVDKPLSWCLSLPGVLAPATPSPPANPVARQP
ncbi:hypothetical protein [Rhodoferax sp.]|uniref:hypothetical protein n=1 Tax=Rhodoferax sp. TaxID=50421 RepID=UPI0027495A51|nr:hypothetical protein [Rhodoferax sp.]